MAEELKDIQKENEELTEEQENEVSEEINDEVEEPTDEVEEPTNEVEEDELTDEEKEELEKAKKEQKKENIINCLIVFGFPGLLVLAFLLTGLLVSGAWRYNWLLFLAIPIYWSGLVAFYKKNPNFFLFPLLAVAIYVFIGLAVKDNKGWHPYWLILLEAPVYYVACWLVKTLLKEEEPKEEVKPEVEPEPESETQPEPEVVPVVKPEPVVKPKKQISHRREKLASKPKEKKVKVVTEDKNYNKKKNKVKIKADISHNPDYKENANEELNNEE